MREVYPEQDRAVSNGKCAKWVKSRIHLMLGCFLVLTLASAVVQAQKTSGQITGTVLDQKGARCRIPR